MKPIPFLIYASCWAFYGCAQTAGKTAFTERTWVLSRNQTIEIREIGLTITNHGCGRKWVSEAGKPSYEKAFCDLDLRYGDSSFRAGHHFDTVRHRDLLVLVRKMNPWGREEDSVPPGGCRVWVKQLR